MGTRADFYVGRGEDAEWIGSITWDGHPDSIPNPVFQATTETGYRIAVAAFFAIRDDVTHPTEPWPWPWKDSGTTDYAYAFDGGQVYGSSFGHGWFEVDPDATDHGERGAGTEAAVFPDMSEREGSLDHVLGRSGLITFTSGAGFGSPNTFGLSDPAQVRAASDGD